MRRLWRLPEPKSYISKLEVRFFVSSTRSPFDSESAGLKSSNRAIYFQCVPQKDREAAYPSSFLSRTPVPL